MVFCAAKAHIAVELSSVREANNQLQQSSVQMEAKFEERSRDLELERLTKTKLQETVSTYVVLSQMMTKCFIPFIPSVVIFIIVLTALYTGIGYILCCILGY